MLTKCGICNTSVETDSIFPVCDACKERNQVMRARNTVHCSVCGRDIDDNSKYKMCATCVDTIYRAITEKGD